MLRAVRPSYVVALAAPLVLCASSVVAADLAQESAPPIGIYMGQEAEPCGWPTTVRVEVEGAHNCSGTLVHPRLITTAAHCLSNPIEASAEVQFLENQKDDGYRVQAECKRFAGYVWGGDPAEDYAYCILEHPVDIPATPILFGCESDALGVGADVTIAGFGAMKGRSEGTGTKRWGPATISEISSGAATIPGARNGLASSCPGDSGGSNFIKTVDGTWRLWGITSAGEFPGTCGVDVHYARADARVGWIEQNSGIDVTPCHDADGTWNPTPMCGNFAANGPDGVGDWAGDRCADTPTTGLSSTCGAAFDVAMDAAAPAVTVASPADQDRFEVGAFGGIVTASASDPDGWPVRRAWLRINGEDLAPRIAGDTYSFEGINLPQGSYTFVVFAEDWSGNVGQSDPVTIGVGQDPGEENLSDTGAEAGESGGESGGSEGGSGSSASGSGGPGGEAGDHGEDGGTAASEGTGPGATDSGGGCRTTPMDNATSFALLLLCSVAGRRRR